MENSELREKIKDLSNDFANKMQYDEDGISKQSVLLIISDGEKTSAMIAGSMFTQLNSVVGIAKQDEFLKELIKLANVYI